MAALEAVNTKVVSTTDGSVSTGVDSTGIRSHDRHPYSDWLRIGALVAAGICLVFLCTVSRKDCGFDFVYFYTAGKILQLCPPERLYDVELQQSLYQFLHPFPGHYGPSPYPPTVALVFVPFAHFSLSTALRLWQCLTLLLYVGGVLLLGKHFLPKGTMWLSLPLALGFAPFLAETWMGGQFSICAFCGLALALCAQQRKRDLCTGMALSLCLYKPTLLILLVPFLMIAKRYRILAGLTLAGAGLFLTTTAILGWRVWLDYLAYLFAARHVQSWRLMGHYVDGMAFFSLLVGPHMAPFLMLLSMAVILPFLFMAVRHRMTDPVPLLALVMTWTLWINVYVPLYDTILIVPVVMASAQHLGLRAPRRYALSIGFLFTASWLLYGTLTLAHLQLLSVAIVTLGILLFTSGRTPAATRTLRTAKAVGLLADKSIISGTR